MKNSKYVVELIEERLLELRHSIPTLTEEVESTRERLFEVEDQLRTLREEYAGLERCLEELKGSNA